jgi:hypothetical protein
MVGCAFPQRAGSRPVTSAACVTLTSPASAVSKSDTSTRCPRPPASRSRSAASTAMAALWPVSTSTTATPTLCGAPSGSPVTAIHPARACTAKS